MLYARRRLLREQALANSKKVETPKVEEKVNVEVKEEKQVKKNTSKKSK